MAVFAFFWAVGASSALADTLALLVALAGSMLTTLVVVVVATRMGFSETAKTPVPARQRGWFVLVSVLQVAAAAAAAAALVLLGRPELVPGVLCAVVGLHFLPLTAVFRRPLYLWTGLLLCAIGGAGAALALAGEAELARIAVGFAAAAVLWVAALLVSLAAGEPREP